MSEFLRSYLTVAIFVAVAVALVGVSSGWAASCGPTGPAPRSASPTRAASTRSATGWSQSQIRYYIFALLFVMFDVEAVFIFPWAIRLEALRRLRPRRDGRLHRSSSPSASLYAWRKGVLRWV